LSVLPPDLVIAGEVGSLTPATRQENPDLTRRVRGNMISALADRTLEAEGR